MRCEKLLIDTQPRAEALLKSAACRDRNLSLLPRQEQGLHFRADTKMMGVNEPHLGRYKN